MGRWERSRRPIRLSPTFAARSGRVAATAALRSNGAMSEQPTSAQPVDPSAGIESPITEGVADSTAQGDDANTDLQSPTTERVDPDDPEAAIEQATERSRGQD